MKAFGIRAACAGLLAALGLVAGASAAVLFEDHFDAGMSPEWWSIKPSQWAEGGWLHSQDLVPPLGDFNRNSAALVHDGDSSWTNYTFSLTVDPLLTYAFSGEPWERAFIHFRTHDSQAQQYGFDGYNYTLAVIGPLDADGVRYLGLGRAWPGGSVSLWQDFDLPAITSDPMDFVIKLTGPRIEVSVDGQPVIDLVDPDPILYGGIGVGAVWEAHARFDDVVVIPEPAALALAALSAAAFLRRRA